MLYTIYQKAIFGHDIVISHKITSNIHLYIKSFFLRLTSFMKTVSARFDESLQTTD